MKSIIYLMLAISSFGLEAQSISDEKFTWINTHQCVPSNTHAEIFLKVEEDPIVSEFNQYNFTELMKRNIETLKFGNNTNGIIKLKILFLINQLPCLNEIGSIGLKLNNQQIQLLGNQLESINKIRYGKQRNRIVNCQGILYLKIQNGQLESLRNVNFVFKG